MTYPKDLIYNNEQVIERNVVFFIDEMNKPSRIIMDGGPVMCCYSGKNTNGHGCAIAILFPPEIDEQKAEWDKTMVSSIEVVMDEFPFVADKLKECDEDLLSGMQKWHDNCLDVNDTKEQRVSSLLDVLRDLAVDHVELTKEVLKRHGLSYEHDS